MLKATVESRKSNRTVSLLSHVFVALSIFCFWAFWGGIYFINRHASFKAVTVFKVFPACIGFMTGGPYAQMFWCTFSFDEVLLYPVVMYVVLDGRLIFRQRAKASFRCASREFCLDGPNRQSPIANR